MDKVQGAVGGKMDKDAQPGDGVERGADSGANDSTYQTLSTVTTISLGVLTFSPPEINDVANDVGVPQGDDKMMDTAADDKINSEIPFRNK